MVKETYIFKDLKKIVDTKTDLKDKLNAINKYIYKEYKLKSYFCKIFTTRWSFFVGDNDIFLSVKRFKISEEIGFIVEDKNTDNMIYNNIQKSLKALLK